MSSDKQKVIYTLLWGNQCISSQNDRQWEITLFGQEVTCHASTAKTTGSKWWNIPSWEKFHWCVLSLESMWCSLCLKSLDSLWQIVSHSTVIMARSLISQPVATSPQVTLYPFCVAHFFQYLTGSEWNYIEIWIHSHSIACLVDCEWKCFCLNYKTSMMNRRWVVLHISLWRVVLIHA